MRFLLLVLSGFLILVSITSCKQQQKAEARIFERKHLPQNKLQIKYEYKAGDKQYTDSVTIDNQVLKSDTITVVINSKKPSENVPELKN